MAVSSENKWQVISRFFDEKRVLAKISLLIVGFSRDTGYALAGVDLFVLMG